MKYLQVDPNFGAAAPWYGASLDTNRGTVKVKALPGSEHEQAMRPHCLLSGTACRYSVYARCHCGRVRGNVAPDTVTRSNQCDLDGRSTVSCAHRASPRCNPPRCHCAPRGVRRRCSPCAISFRTAKTEGPRSTCCTSTLLRDWPTRTFVQLCTAGGGSCGVDSRCCRNAHTCGHSSPS